MNSITSFAITLTLAISVLGLPAAQGTEIRKVFDGTAAYCPPKDTFTPVAPASALRAVVNGQDLVLSLNVCDNGQWKVDTSGPVQRYTAPNGEKVELHFESFRLVVQTPDWSKTKFIELTDFADTSTATVNIRDIEIENFTNLDISLTAVRTTKTSSGHVFKEDVRWGAFRTSN